MKQLNLTYRANLNLSVDSDRLVLDRMESKNS
jgi:hypothetical protein